MPAGLTVNVGDNATIQVIETALHGGALYSCVDITFADPKDVPEVNETNCFNSTQITSNLIFTSAALESDSTVLPTRSHAFVSLAVATLLVFLFI